MNVLSMADGKKSLLDIAEMFEVPIWSLYSIIDNLIGHQLVSVLEIEYEPNLSN